MRTLLPCALTLALGSALALNGCQLLESNTPTTPATVAVSTKTTTPSEAPKKPAQQKQTQYEQAPDLSNAEILSTPHSGAALNADQAAAQHSTSGLISDANFSSSAGSVQGSGATNQGTTAQQMQNNAALADRLESAPTMGNAQLGAADPYSSVSEGAVNEPLTGSLVFDHPQGNTPSVGTGANVGGMVTPAPAPQTSVSDLSGYQEANTSGCSVTLHNEAAGIARTTIRELATRLRNESGNIFVAPTIVDREYKNCVGNLSTALQDGLLQSNTFQVVPSSGLNNMASQNIGSETMIPRMVNQCRAQGIPYLVISQIKQSGEHAALTLRIMRTSDGITLSQMTRRLSQ